jgi:hypothetical protein
VNVTIAERDGAWEILTPDFRLTFLRLDDRWTHRIDVSPGPWQTFATPVEWTTAAESPLRVLGPVYQEVQVKNEGDSVVALAVGQAGPHHFAAAVRVRHQYTETEPTRAAGLVLSKSVISFDVADRCRSAVESFDCRYVVHDESGPSLLGPCDEYTPQPYAPEREEVCWETRAGSTWGVYFRSQNLGTERGLIRVTEDASGSYEVRLAAATLVPGGTNRLRYAWDHVRKCRADDLRPPGTVVFIL